MFSCLCPSSYLLRPPCMSMLTPSHPYSYAQHVQTILVLHASPHLSHFRCPNTLLILHLTSYFSMSHHTSIAPSSSPFSQVSAYHPSSPTFHFRTPSHS